MRTARSTVSAEEERHDSLWKRILAKRPLEPEDVQALKKSAAPGTKPLDKLRPCAEARDHDLYWGMGETLLHLAARLSQVDAARLLLSKGAGINVVSRPSDPSAGSTGTALHAACASGAVEIVQMLLEAKADRRPAKSGAGSALQIACAQGHLEVVNLLVNRQVVALIVLASAPMCSPSPHTFLVRSRFRYATHVPHLRSQLSGRRERARLHRLSRQRNLNHAQAQRRRHGRPGIGLDR